MGDRGTVVPAPPDATRRSRAELVAILTGFTLYAVFLLKVLFLSRAPGTQRSVNLVPLQTISSYVSAGSAGLSPFAWANVVGNVVLFIPLGVYARWFGRRAPGWLALLAVAAVSVAAEVLQWVLAVGSSDVDDVILNSLGGLVGIAAVLLVRLVVRSPTRVRTATAALSLLSVPVWCFLIVIVQLHL
ncbi:MAG: VanZ family protein [Actinomycetales bacterium]